MNLLLALTALAAIVSVSFRAIGPRKNGWNEPPDMDTLSFHRSFGVEPE
jgi:hypothetical protein